MSDPNRIIVPIPGNSDPIDQLLFTFIMSSPAELFATSILGALLQAFVYGVLVLA